MVAEHPILRLSYICTPPHPLSTYLDPSKHLSASCIGSETATVDYALNNRQQLAGFCSRQRGTDQEVAYKMLMAAMPVGLERQKTAAKTVFIRP